MGRWMVEHSWYVIACVMLVMPIHEHPIGQIAGLSSTEFGLSNMIWAAVVVAKVRSASLGTQAIC